MKSESNLNDKILDLLGVIGLCAGAVVAMLIFLLACTLLYHAILGVGGRAESKLLEECQQIERKRAER